MGTHSRGTQAVIGMVLAAMLLVPLASPAHASTIHAAIGVTDPGSSWHTVGSAIARVLLEHSHINLSVESTGGSLENARLVDAGMLEFGMSSTIVPLFSYHELGGFARLSNIAPVFAWTETYWHIITRANSNIHTFDDLRGKRVSVGAPGSGTWMETEIVLDVAGIGPRDMHIERLGLGPSVQALRDGRIDAFFLNFNWPTPAITELAASIDIRLIPYPQDLREALSERVALFRPDEFPANAYPGISDPVQTIRSPNVLITRADMDEEIVYEFVRTIFENLESLHPITPSADGINLDNALRYPGVPYHPGAERYYREIGILQ